MFPILLFLQILKVIDDGFTVAANRVTTAEDDVTA